MGEIRIFSVKICINPYPPLIYASMYRENVHAIHIAMQFAKKSRHCVIEIDSQQQRTKIGALLHVARQSKSPVLRKFSGKASCVDNKTFVSLFIIFFSVICFKSVSQRDTAVSSQKRPKSVLDTDNPYHGFQVKNL